MKLRNSLVQSVICLTVILGVGFSVSGCGKKVAATAAKKEEAKANENAAAPKADDKGDKKPPAVELVEPHKTYAIDIVNYVLTQEEKLTAEDKDLVATVVLKCSGIKSDQKADGSEYAPLEMKLAFVTELDTKKDALGTVDYLFEDNTVKDSEVKVYTIKSGKSEDKDGKSTTTMIADTNLCDKEQGSEILVTFTKKAK